MAPAVQGLPVVDDSASQWPRGGSGWARGSCARSGASTERGCGGRLRSCGYASAGRGRKRRRRRQALRLIDARSREGRGCREGQWTGGWRDSRSTWQLQDGQLTRTNGQTGRGSARGCGRRRRWWEEQAGWRSSGVGEGGQCSSGVGGCGAGGRRWEGQRRTAVAWGRSEAGGGQRGRHRTADDGGSRVRALWGGEGRAQRRLGGDQRVERGHLRRGSRWSVARGRSRPG